MADEGQNDVFKIQYSSQSRKRQHEETYNPNNDPKEDEKLKLIDNIKSIVCQNRSGNNPLNIVVLGCPGSGKSAFLNTVITSLRTDCWTERAKVGSFGSNGQQVTKHVISFTSELDYYHEEPEAKLPTFIDVQGLENDDNAFNKEFLQALLNGKIRNNQSMAELHSIFDNEGQEKLQTVLNRQNDNLKVDRIIVVESADPSANLPKQFLSCIHEAMLCKRDIPIFGVLTRADKFERNDERMSTFMNALGITEDKCLLMTNYCPDIDTQKRYHNNVFPYIDVPVLRFLKQVVNPHLKVIAENTKLLNPDWIGILKSDLTDQGLMVMVQILLIMVLLFLISYPTLSPEKLNKICADYDIYAEKHDVEIYDLYTLCSEKKKFSAFPVAKVFMFMLFVVFVLPLLERQKQLIIQTIDLLDNNRKRAQEGEFDFYIYAVVFSISFLVLCCFILN